jgi:hypothetical protein
MERSPVKAKRSAICLLALFNTVLLLALLAAVHERGEVFAQGPGGRPGNFAMVSAKVASQTYEVLYWLDVPARKLYAFYPGPPPRNERVSAPPRDLDKDFGRK